MDDTTLQTKISPLHLRALNIHIATNNLDKKDIIQSGLEKVIPAKTFDAASKAIKAFGKSGNGSKQN